MSNKATEKENRVWDLSCEVFNSKKTILCYPASSVLSGKQMCTLLVLSGSVGIATASPAAHSAMLGVSVGLGEMVRAQREAAESSRETNLIAAWQ